jgi:hypothetical protein
MSRMGKRLKGPRFYWNDDKLAQLRALLATNATLVSIAKSFGVPVYTIGHAVKQYELIGYCGRKQGPKVNRVVEQPKRAQSLPTEPGWPTKSQLMAGR